MPHQSPMQSGPFFLSKGLFLFCITFIFLGVGSRMVVIGMSRYFNQSAENAALNGVLDLSEGTNIYPPNTISHFRLFTYTPLHALLIGSLIKPLKQFSLLTRVYAVRLSSFFLLLLIYYLIWQFHLKPHSLSFSVMILAIALSFSEFGNYALSARNDFLALFFEVLASVFFLSWIKKQTYSWLVIFAVTCVLTFLTRQNTVGMVLAGGGYLLLTKRFREFIVLSIIYCSSLIIGLFLTGHFYPYFFDHAFKAHAIFWRPFYWTELSTISFFICYSSFLFLSLRFLAKPQASKSLSFLKLSVFTSALGPAIQIYRPGAWFNYFFESILFLIVFCALEISFINQLAVGSRYRKLIVLCMVFISITIGSLHLFKAKKQFTSTAFLNFANSAEKVRELAPTGGVTLGALGQGIGVYLRDWEVLGPEILNGAHYGETNYPHFKWAYQRLATLINSETPPALLYANLNCGADKEASVLISDPYLMPLMGAYQLHTVIAPWLCLYKPKKQS